MIRIYIYIHTLLDLNCLFVQTGRKRVANEMISALAKLWVKKKMSLRRDDPQKLEEPVACLVPPSLIPLNHLPKEV